MIGVVADADLLRIDFCDNFVLGDICSFMHVVAIWGLTVVARLCKFTPNQFLRYCIQCTQLSPLYWFVLINKILAPRSVVLSANSIGSSLCSF